LLFAIGINTYYLPQKAGKNALFLIFIVLGEIFLNISQVVAELRYESKNVVISAL